MGGHHALALVNTDYLFERLLIIDKKKQIKTEPYELGKKNEILTI